MVRKLKGGKIQNTTPNPNVEPPKGESIPMTKPQAEKIIEKSESWYNSIKKLADKAGVGETLDKAIDAVNPVIKGAGSFINSASDGQLDGSSVVKMVSGLAEIGNGVLEGVSKSPSANKISSNIKKVLSAGGEVVGLMKDAGVAFGIAYLIPSGGFKAIQAIKFGSAIWTTYNNAHPLEKFNAIYESFKDAKVSELGSDLKALFSEVSEHSAAHVYHGAADIWAAGCDMLASIPHVSSSLFVNTLTASGEKLQEVYNNPEAMDIIKGAAIGGVMLGVPVAAMGAGLGLTTYGGVIGGTIGGHIGYEKLSDAASNAVAKASELASAASKAIQDGASYVAGKAGEGFSAAKDGASYAAGKASELASAASKAIQDGASYVAEKTGEGAAIGGEKLAEIYKGISDFFSENYVKFFSASSEPAEQPSTPTEDAVHDVNAKLYDLTHKLDDAIHKMVQGEGIASKVNAEFSQVKEAIAGIKYPTEMSYGDKFSIDKSFQNLSKMADVLIKGNPDTIKAAMQQFANDHQKIINHFEALEKSDPSHKTEWHNDVDTLKADHTQIDADIKAYEDAHHD